MKIVVLKSIGNDKCKYICITTNKNLKKLENNLNSITYTEFENRFGKYKEDKMNSVTLEMYSYNIPDDIFINNFAVFQ